MYQEQGLEAFLKHEQQNAQKPLPDGPGMKIQSLCFPPKAWARRKKDQRFSLSVDEMATIRKPCLSICDGKSGER